jgi:hypothetical protein
MPQGNRSGGSPFLLKRHGVEHGGTPEAIAIAQSRDAWEDTSRHAQDGQP